MKVSIVIPNWNGEDKLRKNLPEVLKVKGVEEVIVVDDRSTDGSVGLVEKSFPEVILIKKSKNEGFSSTVNLGVAKATGDLVFLLNTDAVPDADCLKFIIPHFDDPKVFSVGLGSGGNWSWAKFEKGYFWHYMSDEKVKDVHETMWVSGGSGVFKKSIWDKLGGFDELFNPFYEEDLDLGYRALKRGYINLFEPKAKALHQNEEGVISKNFSRDKISQIAQRNQLFFIWKNMTDKGLINQHINALIFKLMVSPKYWLVFLSAITWWGQIVKERRIEIKESVVSNKEILERLPH